MLFHKLFNLVYRHLLKQAAQIAMFIYLSRSFATRKLMPVFGTIS